MERRARGDHWQAKGLLEWAAKELTMSRRDLELEFGDIQDWRQREEMERRMGDSLLKWLGLDKPPQHRVRHKVWRKQLVDSTRQLRLGADMARQRTELEMLGGTEVVNVGPTWSRASGQWLGGVWIGANAESIAEAGGGYPADAMRGEEEGHNYVWEEWASGDWVEGTGIDSRTGAEAEEAVVAAAEAVAGAQPGAEA